MSSTESATSFLALQWFYWCCTFPYSNTAATRVHIDGSPFIYSLCISFLCQSHRQCIFMRIGSRILAVSRMQNHSLNLQMFLSFFYREVFLWRFNLWRFYMEAWYVPQCFTLIMSFTLFSMASAFYFPLFYQRWMNSAKNWNIAMLICHAIAFLGTFPYRKKYFSNVILTQNKVYKKNFKNVYS